jgi:TRAP-type C4-dicarboxylate transport system substrate-binding protein
VGRLVQPDEWQGLARPSARPQAVLANNMNEAVLKARADLVWLNKTVADDLKKNGMIFNDTDPNEFRSTLSKNGYYKRWKETFGPEAWALLEKFSGPLV